MAYVKRIVSMLGYRIPTVQYGHQEESLLFVIDLEKDDDPTIVVRKAHNMIAELLWNGINHGAVQQAGALMFKEAKWKDDQIERGVFFDLDGSSDAGDDYEEGGEEAENWREKLKQIADDDEMVADSLSDVDEKRGGPARDDNSDIPF